MVAENQVCCPVEGKGGAAEDLPYKSLGFAKMEILQRRTKILSTTSIIEKRLLGVKDLATYIGLRPQTIYNMVCTGRFPIKHKRIGRLLKWELCDINLYLDGLPGNH
jgi:predicted DNA-binding transcriptional regulator AlpA